ncbi:hypothetical protein BDZ97DRAFT_1761853 [Flammula alnicola]|nr:hypothetical protein BDZ97DRAFT_1761853 [Flammula alnicola]
MDYPYLHPGSLYIDHNNSTTICGDPGSPYIGHSSVMQTLKKDITTICGHPGSLYIGHNDSTIICGDPRSPHRAYVNYDYLYMKSCVMQSLKHDIGNICGHPGSLFINHMSYGYLHVKIPVYRPRSPCIDHLSYDYLYMKSGAMHTLKKDITIICGHPGSPFKGLMSYGYLHVKDYMNYHYLPVSHTLKHNITTICGNPGSPYIDHVNDHYGIPVYMPHAPWFPAPTNDTTTTRAHPRAPHGASVSSHYLYVKCSIMHTLKYDITTIWGIQDPHTEPMHPGSPYIGQSSDSYLHVKIILLPFVGIQEPRTEPTWTMIIYYLSYDYLYMKSCVMHTLKKDITIICGHPGSLYIGHSGAMHTLKKDITTICGHPGSPYKGDMSDSYMHVKSPHRAYVNYDYLYMKSCVMQSLKHDIGNICGHPGSLFINHMSYGYLHVKIPVYRPHYLSYDYLYMKSCVMHTLKKDITIICGHPGSLYIGHSGAMHTLKKDITTICGHPGSPYIGDMSDSYMHVKTPHRAYVDCDHLIPVYMPRSLHRAYVNSDHLHAGSP